MSSLNAGFALQHIPKDWRLQLKVWVSYRSFQGGRQQEDDDSVGLNHKFETGTGLHAAVWLISKKKQISEF
jgi:hypothetical protein